MLDLVCDPMFAGLCENNDMDERVMDCVSWIASNYGEYLTAEQMEDSFDKFGIEYPFLPKYLKAEFDKFEIVE